MHALRPASPAVDPYPPPLCPGSAVASLRNPVHSHSQTHSQTQTRRQSKQVSDEGGGIKREQMGRVFAFLYTTARDNSNSFDDVEDFGTQSPMAGLGYGLPVARLYARYSTGNLIRVLYRVL